MKRIAIGEERQYARRLSDYLNDHMSGYVHVYSITVPDQMMLQEEADLYLLGEDFHQELREKGWSVDSDKVLVLGDEEGEGSLYKWQSPKEWLGRIEKKLCGREKMDYTRGDAPLLVALYCPDSSQSIREYAEGMMEAGSLFLGFEDVGEYLEDRSTMAELGYYIHLHEERILPILKEVAVEENGRYYVDSSGGFYDLIGITEEDYRWFYEKLREESTYGRIYVALGNASISSLGFFKIFDQVLILDPVSNSRIHGYCKRLTVAVEQENHFSKKDLSLLPLHADNPKREEWGHEASDSGRLSKWKRERMGAM